MVGSPKASLVFFRAQPHRLKCVLDLIMNSILVKDLKTVLINQVIDFMIC